jgi:hypothetical protein
MSHCIFCFRHKSITKQDFSDPPPGVMAWSSIPFAAIQKGAIERGNQAELITSGVLCSYGCNHEFEADTVEAKKPKQVAKPSRDICTLCSLHKKNPAMVTSNCEHQYPT